MSEHRRRTRIVATSARPPTRPTCSRWCSGPGVDAGAAQLLARRSVGAGGAREAVRAMAQRIGREVGILADLPEPKIRVGDLHRGQGAR